jgi:hypothetical protein
MFLDILDARGPSVPEASYPTGATRSGLCPNGHNIETRFLTDIYSHGGRDFLPPVDQKISALHPGLRDTAWVFLLSQLLHERLEESLAISHTRFLHASE